jgi:hypothetical protein
VVGGRRPPLHRAQEPVDFGAAPPLAGPVWPCPCIGCTIHRCWASTRASGASDRRRPAVCGSVCPVAAKPKEQDPAPCRIRTFVLGFGVRCRPLVVMWTLPSRAFEPAGEPQLRGSSVPWPWRLRRPSRSRTTSPPRPSPRPLPWAQPPHRLGPRPPSRRCPVSGSSTPDSRRSMPSSVPAGYPPRPASPSAATDRVVGRRSPCASRRRPRHRARSSPGSICHAASTRSRRSAGGSVSSGSWSSPRPISMRACASPAAWWRVVPWTYSCWTCPVVACRRQTQRRRSPIDSTGWPPWPVARRPCC